MTAWICAQCGEVSGGDFCLECGNSRPIPQESAIPPGSSYPMVGLHHPIVFKTIGTTLAVLVGFVGGVIREPYYFLIDALLLSPFWLPPCFGVTARIRLRFARFLVRNR